MAWGRFYRARDTKLWREVALKVLDEAFVSDPDRLARFEREAKTLALLNHPHIAHIHGFEERGPTHALVMELVDGEHLAQHIARGAVPIDEALAIARQIAEALEAAHERGIVHRDLKPANIKRRPDGFDGFFRGDLIRKPTGEGTWLITSLEGVNGIRLRDVEQGTTVWERPVPGHWLSLPVFSRDGRSISVPVQENLRRDAIWVLDTTTGSHRVAVRFQIPFDIDFRVSWVDDGTAFIVNRREDSSHIVLFDRFWVGR